MDNVRSYLFAGANGVAATPTNKENSIMSNQAQQQQQKHDGLGFISGRWLELWNQNAKTQQSVGSAKYKTTTVNQMDIKRKDKDNYFYIMWHA